MFDLGSYPAGQSRSVTFEKAGKVQVECAIHPMMRMVIEVR
jgi:plastocyanin